MTDWTKVNPWTADSPRRKSARETYSGDSDRIIDQANREIEAEKEAREESYQSGYDDASDDSEPDEEY